MVAHNNGGLHSTSAPHPHPLPGLLLSRRGGGRGGGGFGPKTWRTKNGLIRFFSPIVNSVFSPDGHFGLGREGGGFGGGVPPPYSKEALTALARGGP